MRPWFVILIALAALPLAARAATYTIVTYDCQAGALEVYRASVPGNWQQIFNDCSEPGLRSEVSGRAGRGQLRTWARGVDESPAGAQNWSGRGGIAVTMQFDDVIIRGPGPTVMVSLQLEFHALLNVVSPAGSSTAFLELSVALGVNHFFMGLASVNEGSDPAGLQAAGLLDGLFVPSPGGGYAIDGIVTTPAVEMPVDSTIRLLVVMRSDAESYNPSGQADTVSDAGQTLSFPAAGPVFVLPEGYSVESEEAGIVGNQWGGEVTVERETWGAVKGRY